MSSENIYVQIDFDEQVNGFKCLTDGLGEVVAILKAGDVFTLSHQGTTVLGKIVASSECQPYGYEFVSADGQFTIELNDGMYGYLKRL